MLTQTNDADVRNEKELTAPTIYSHYESTVSQDDRKGTKDAKMRIKSFELSATILN